MFVWKGYMLYVIVCVTLCMHDVTFAFTKPKRTTPKKTVAKSIAKKSPAKKGGKQPTVTKQNSKSTAKPVPATNTAQIQIAARQKELLSLQKSIQADRKKIEALASKETATTQAIGQYQKHSDQIQRYMGLLSEEIESLQDKAEDVNSQSKEVAGDLWRLRQCYAQLIKNVVIKGTPSVQEMMLAPHTETDPVLEEVGMQRLTKHATQATRTMVSARDSLSNRGHALMTKADMRTALLTLKNNEQQQLDKTIAAKQKALQKIRTDKTQLLEQIKKNEQSAQAVNRLIAGMVTKDEKAQPKTTTASTPRGKKLPTTSLSATSAPVSGAFKQSGLPFPVSSHKILHGYGTYRNPVTNTQTNNPGIDISTPRGSNVSAVASGTVSLVHWLPGYGSLVILDHKNGYRTVYANLSSVAVKQGAAVNAGQSVGKSGESVDGEFVHLELWYQRQRLNPSAYLK